MDPQRTGSGVGGRWQQGQLERQVEREVATERQRQRGGASPPPAGARRRAAAVQGPSVEVAEVKAAEGEAAASPVAVAPAVAPSVFSRLAVPEAKEASPWVARKLARLKEEEGRKRAQQDHPGTPAVHPVHLRCSQKVWTGSFTILGAKVIVGLKPAFLVINLVLSKKVHKFTAAL
jgi:hypothetical protein